MSLPNALTQRFNLLFLFSDLKGCISAFYHSIRIRIQAGSSQILSRPPAGRLEPPVSQLHIQELINGVCWLETPPLPHTSLTCSLFLESWMSWLPHLGGLRELSLAVLRKTALGSHGELSRSKCPAPSRLLHHEREESTEPRSACWYAGWFDCLGSILQCLLIFYPFCPE